MCSLTKPVLTCLEDVYMQYYEIKRVLTPVCVCTCKNKIMFTINHLPFKPVERDYKGKLFSLAWFVLNFLINSPYQFSLLCGLYRNTSMG